MLKHTDDLPNLITRLVTADPNILAEADEELRRLRRTFEAEQRDPAAGIRYGRAQYRAGQVRLEPDDKALLKGMFIELKDLKGEDPDWDFIYDIMIGEHPEIEQPEELVAIIEDHYKKVLNNFKTYFSGPRFRNNVSYRRALARVHSVKAVHLAIAGKSFKHILRRVESVVYPRAIIQAIAHIFFGGQIDRDRIISFIDQNKDSADLNTSPIGNRVKRLIKFLTTKQSGYLGTGTGEPEENQREQRVEAINQLIQIAALFPNLNNKVAATIQSQNDYRIKMGLSTLIDLSYFRERVREFQVDYYGVS